MIDYIKDCGFGERDLELMNAYVRKWGHPDAMPMEQYLEYWYAEKSKYLLPMFGYKSIVSEEVSFETPECLLREKMDDAVIANDDYSDMTVWLREILRTVLTSDGQDCFYYSYRDEDEDYVDERNAYWVANDIRSQLTNSRVMVDNKILCSPCLNYIIKPAKWNHLMKAFSVSPNQKPFRVISHIVRDLWPIANRLNNQKFPIEERDKNLAIIEKYRIIHSQVLNDKSMHGKLSLSIHPMDYITASDNNCSWSSCMAWTREDEPGEFRNGVLEMMTSPMVVVAYLESDSPYYPMGENYIPWSNKRWREFFIVERSYISGIKGYPYTSENLENIIINKLADMAENYGWPRYDRLMRESRYGEIEERALTTWLMYNDTMYNPINYLFSTEPAADICTHYSGECHCVVCGRNISEERDEERYEEKDEDDRNTNTPVCELCHSNTKCAKCGCTLYLYPGHWYEINGKRYCSDCVNTCAACGRPSLRSDLQEFGFFVNYGTDENPQYDDIHRCICPSCIEDNKDYIFHVKIPTDSPLIEGWLWYPKEFDTISKNAPNDTVSTIIKRRFYHRPRAVKVVDLIQYQTEILT